MTLTLTERNRIWPGEDWEPMDDKVESVCVTMKEYLWTGKFDPIPWDLNVDEVAFLRAALAVIDCLDSWGHVK